MQSTAAPPVTRHRGEGWVREVRGAGLGTTRGVHPLHLPNNLYDPSPMPAFRLSCSAGGPAVSCAGRAGCCCCATLVTGIHLPREQTKPQPPRLIARLPAETWPGRSRRAGAGAGPRLGRAPLASGGDGDGAILWARVRVGGWQPPPLRPRPAAGVPPLRSVRLYRPSRRGCAAGRQTLPLPARAVAHDLLRCRQRSSGPGSAAGPARWGSPGGVSPRRQRSPSRWHPARPGSPRRR